MKAPGQSELSQCYDFFFQESSQWSVVSGPLSDFDLCYLKFQVRIYQRQLVDSSSPFYKTATQTKSAIPPTAEAVKEMVLSCWCLDRAVFRRGVLLLRFVIKQLEHCG